MKQSRPCIFCGGAGLTKEHLFADWLTELFPHAEKDRRTFGTTTEWPNFTLTAENGHSGAKKVREVCNTCNNGWMSRIDERAKPIAVEMIQAKPITVAPEDQKTLATWLTKVAMVGDNVEREGSRISQEHRNYLRERNEPPPTWQVWVTSYGGWRWHHLRMEQLRSPFGLPNRPKTYFTSSVVGMGTMLAVVVGHGADGIKLEIGESGKQLQQIWPASQTFDWPTEHDLSDEDADAFTTVGKNLRPVIA